MQGLTRSMTGHETGPDDLRVLPLLMSLSRASRQFVALKMAEIGVVVGQDHFLDMLDDVKTYTTQEAADKLNVRASTISKMADRMQENGWIIKSADIVDQRKVNIVLTQAGVAVRNKIRGVWQAIDDEILAAIEPPVRTDDSFDQLIRVNEALQRRLSRLR